MDLTLSNDLPLFLAGGRKHRCGASKEAQFLLVTQLRHSEGGKCQSDLMCSYGGDSSLLTAGMCELCCLLEMNMCLDGVLFICGVMRFPTIRERVIACLLG